MAQKPLYWPFRPQMTLRRDGTMLPRAIPEAPKPVKPPPPRVQAEEFCDYCGAVHPHGAEPHDRIRPRFHANQLGIVRKHIAVDVWQDREPKEE